MNGSPERVLSSCVMSILLVCSPACRRPTGPETERAVDKTSVNSTHPVALMEVLLPQPTSSATTPLEQTIARRRSVREFTAQPLTQTQLGQLAWAAQGITDPTSHLRAAPSAGALYPIEVYFATADGLFHYLPTRHVLQRTTSTDVRVALSEAALHQQAVRLAPCAIVITSVTDRTRIKYGDRAARYVAIEAGHVGQNILLEATALGLGGVPIGAFEDDAVRRVLSLHANEDPLYLIAIGHASKE